MSRPVEPPSARLWLLLALLYFSQGLPLGVVMDALPTLLRRQGADLAMLAWLPLAGLPWVVKFSWAAAVENHWSARLGRRRSWQLPMQALVLLVLATIAWIGIDASSSAWVIALATVGSLASATQDIATDGMAAERFSAASLARVNALQVGGTMVGFYTGGAGQLMLAGWIGQRPALWVLTALVALSLLLVLTWREPPPPHCSASTPPPQARLRQFLQRRHSVRLLLLTLACASTSVAAYALSRLLLTDAHWPLQQIGQLSMLGGVATIFIGCGAGAWLVGRYGSRPILVTALAISALAAGLWLQLAWQPRIAWLPAAVATVLGCIGAGLASLAVMTWAMRFAGAASQPGTDMTAVQSTRDLAEIAAPAALTALAAQCGYPLALASALLLAVVIATWVWTAPLQLDG